ncbi:Nascent polypeptide associated complex NAC [Methanothermus fervidus DSM 2088]|uniref:Nascent polypeptide-associated complex protein n=1 Tax=Methanothermus fervidus (strain ATCC 43054 / DSM 2088 / JCM 10308 / V24 S) TaxID=523846 RepID=E3GX70_METFV|nr:nascent polypeptide-associated complex protein [Methanothermus fervidus]ADP78065.1 Nascent polypeptide associated complex NAC [Methanothermus fervidus DSM 2088]
MIPGMDPRQLRRMQKVMKQMGMKMEELKGVNEVIIKMNDKELVIKNPSVTLMDLMGQKTYQVTGKVEERKVEEKIPEEDIKLVMEQTGVSRDEAEKALKESNGDIAEAIMRLS